MNDKSPSIKTLEAWLALTREDEIDCDRFAQLIAPWLDQTISEPRLLELLEHHRELCSECAEEVRLVQAALGKDG
jgi:hypothetical protein